MDEGCENYLRHDSVLSTFALQQQGLSSWLHLVMDEESCGIKIHYSIRSEDFRGKGIFAEERISSGSLIWRYQCGFNVIEYDGNAAAVHLEKMSMIDAKYFLDATYGLQG